jgi:transposase
MELTDETVSVESLGHLGLIAAMIKKLGLPEKINKRLPICKEKGAIVPHGSRVAAMIINGLGFINRTLYLSPDFFEDKAVSTLLGENIEAKHLNDDCLGRGLDEIAEYGTTKLYSEILFETMQEQSMLDTQMRTDTTTFSLFGDYSDADVASETAPLPTHGYSKDHRPDLKQVTLSMTQMGSANIPVWMEALDGNSSDRSSFQETVRSIQRFCEDVNSLPDNLFFILDAAFYTPEKLAELNRIGWITRVPATLKDSKELLCTPEQAIDWQGYDDNYRTHVLPKTIHGHEQRWLLVSSKHAYKKELKTFNKRMQKKTDELIKTFWHLGNQLFQCKDDAVKAIEQEKKQLKYHGIDYEIKPIMKHAGKGRPKADSEQSCQGYQIVANPYSDLDKVQLQRETLGRFILATNELESDKLEDHDILRQYKQQYHIEHGFAFMKDRRFQLSAIFLKSPKRIGALMMVMTLCLAVYNFAQHQLKQSLEASDDVLPNQLGKPIKNPTPRWVFQMMSKVAVARIVMDEGKSIKRIVTNIKLIQRIIIYHFGKEAMKLYGMPDDFKLPPYDKNKKSFEKWCGI